MRKSYRLFTKWAEKVKISSPPLWFVQQLNFTKEGFFYVLNLKWGNVRKQVMSEN